MLSLAALAVACLQSKEAGTSVLRNISKRVTDGCVITISLLLPIVLQSIFANRQSVVGPQGIGVSSRSNVYDFVRSIKPDYPGSQRSEDRLSRSNRLEMKSHNL